MTNEDKDNMRIITSKLSTIQEQFHPAANVPEDDLLFISTEDERWQRIRAVVERVGEDDTDVVKSFKKFIDLAICGNAFMSKGYEQKAEFKRN